MKQNGGTGAFKQGLKENKTKMNGNRETIKDKL